MGRFLWSLAFQVENVIKLSGSWHKRGKGGEMVNIIVKLSVKFVDEYEGKEKLN